MSHGVFRYFLPCNGDVSPKQLQSDPAARTAEVKRRGLWDRLADIGLDGPHFRCELNHIHKGPDGIEGLLIAPTPYDDSPVERGKFDAEHQTWLKSTLGDYWIGWDMEYGPTPGGLRRRELVPGYEHELGDGRIWQCPTIRRAVVIPCVPCSYSMLSGTLQPEPLAEYVDIYQRSLAWAAAYVVGARISTADGFEAFWRCLGLNYRIGPEEVSILKLYTDRSVKDVLDSAVDMPWWNSALDGSDPQKKRIWDGISSALESIGRGVPDASPDTGPALPT